MKSISRVLIRMIVTLGVVACCLPTRAVADIAGSRDHPLLSRYPGSEIIAYEAKDYDAILIASDKKSHWVTGKMTWIVYQAAADNSTLQIYRNYQVALADAGFEVAYACEREACGRDFIKHSINARGRMVGGAEYWMPGSGRYLAASKSDSNGNKTWVSLLVHERDRAGTVAIRESIVESGKARAVNLASELEANFPGARRFGGLYRKYDEAKVPVAAADHNELTHVLALEGELQWKVYALPRHISGIEVLTSYTHALHDAGFEEVFQCGGSECGNAFMRESLALSRSITKNGDHWIEDSVFYRLMRRESASGTVHMAIWAYTQPNGYDAVRGLRVVAKPLRLGLIKVSAEAMAKELRTGGKVQIYGIYFDVDKARVRADSKPVLDEIARMLTANKDIALYVDGHTDSQGEDPYNLDLSERRAAAVVAALVDERGIDPARLQARGFGESRPVASNDAEIGRAKNRRVELVMRPGS
ncbi:MAG: OmpA family protein [Rhodanobacteraceae bacterium]